MKTVEIHPPQTKDRDKVSEKKLLRSRPPKKNRDKVSEIKTVEIHTPQKIGIGFMK